MTDAVIMHELDGVQKLTHDPFKEVLVVEVGLVHFLIIKGVAVVGASFVI